MKYTTLLFSIIAIVCVIGTFTYVMVKNNDTPNEHSTSVLRAAQRRITTATKKKSCKCCDKQRERLRKQILQERERKQSQKQVPVKTETMLSN